MDDRFYFEQAIFGEIGLLWFNPKNIPRNHTLRRTRSYRARHPATVKVTRRMNFSRTLIARDRDLEQTKGLLIKELE